MKTAAESYRDLVKRLDELDLPPGAEPEADYKPAVAEIPTIDAPNFNSAYAQAKKQGLKKFKWCGTYLVKDKAPTTGQAAQPAAPAKKQNFTVTNPMGDFDPTSFSGDFTRTR